MRTVGVTLGDPTGIGPEVMCAAARAVPRPDGVSLTLFAPEPLTPALGDWPGEVRAVPLDVAPDWEVGRPSLAANRAAFLALAQMCDAAAAGELAAMVTGPVAKGIFDHLDPQPPGQTEYISGRLGVARFAMMLAGPKLRVVPVTTHLPLRDVPAALTCEGIVDATLAATNDLRRWLGIPAPRVAVCGLNPHAGEGGRLGDEEARVIAPAVAQLRQELHVDAHGPLPADALFHQAVHGQWDLVVCMYHDQALGPLKLQHFYDGWNQTCGLPVPRLSPDHGTAWGIAGQGKADARSASAALSLAVSIAAADRA